MSNYQNGRWYHRQYHGLFGSTDLVLGRRILYLGRTELERLIIPQLDLKKKSMSSLRANKL